jgi:uncharacterized protein
MAGWKEDSTGSFYNYLSKGCQVCRQGAGLVLFVTGACGRDCFYCPLSEERRGRDVTYANERKVKSTEDILEEARLIGALGTGITGGEPLMKLDYVLECIRALKEAFGPQHHIHLYTGTIPRSEILRRLRSNGLDEIRIHPPDSVDPGDLERALRVAKGLGMDAGVEIPALNPAPGMLQAVRKADAFINLNELEFSCTNHEALERRGFRPKRDGCGAAGSEEIVRKHFMDLGTKIHYCPSMFKDSVQLRERLKRRAQRVARPFDAITEDGTLLYGEIFGDVGRIIEALKRLKIPFEAYSMKEDCVEISARVLEEISKELRSIGLITSLIERYPLEDGLVVERIPL